MHDLGLKTSFSYGTESPAKILQRMSKLGITTVSFTDAFELEQNSYPEIAGVPAGMSYLNGSEWFTRLDGRGFGRVDLLFVGFDLTDPLKAWVARERKLMTYKWQSMPVTMGMDKSWRNKYEFARLVSVRGLKRTYFDTLPPTEVVIERFVAAGGHVFLSDLPFTNSFSAKCRIVRRLKELGLAGIVVFKNHDKYLDAESEIQQTLDLCKHADVIPVVGSGISSNYGSRSVVYENATEAFTYLTRQLKQRLNSEVTSGNYCQ